MRIRGFAAVGAALFASMQAGAAGAVTTAVSTDATALANALAGTGVHVVGATLSGDAAAGIFSNGATALGMSNGVVLSTGADLGCIGSANLAGGCSASIGGSYATSRTLTVQFIADTSDLSFDYVFGSEEYNSYVGGLYNDSFTMTLTGAGYAGVNIALLPDGEAVSTNTVNLDRNSAYYRNNSNELTGADTGKPSNSSAPSLNLPIELDGLTTVLTAKATKLTAGANYTLAFTVADVGDQLYDSAVFLRAGSMRSTPAAVPEPMSWALMTSGFGLAGGVLRRRSMKARLV